MKKLLALLALLPLMTNAQDFVKGADVGFLTGQEVVFAGNTGVSIAPTAEDVAGFERYIDNYKKCLPIEQAAVEAK